MHILAKKLKAILEAETAECARTLATTLHPLNVLCNSQPWRWSQECPQVFQEAKCKLTEAPVLIHFLVKIPLQLAGVTSAYGVEAVISNVIPNGAEHPIAFASHTLSPSEHNHSQWRRKLFLLSLVFTSSSVLVWVVFHNRH